MSKILKSRYPILLAPMNKVSDLNLAIAAYEAGIFPSISIFNYFDILIEKINYKNLEKDLVKFKEITKSSDILLSIGDTNLLDKEFIDIYNSDLFTHLEIILEQYSYHKSQKFRYFKQLKNQKISSLLKIWNYRILETELYDIFDGYILKGPDGAGTIPIDELSLEQRLETILRKKPEAKIIASGGIYNGNQIKNFLQLGADSVAIGTVFSLCQESCISYESKKRILNSNSEMLSSVSHIKQNALLFKKIQSSESDLNNSASLRIGIDSPNLGHIFVGKAIDYVDDILPLKVIVDKIIKELNSH